jgi:diguanylate cyclase (GGDEF)-like protein/putative nucleotidyltransferase with HDIG domain
VQTNEQNLSVLLVESDAETLNLLKQSLERGGRFPIEVDSANTVGKALRKIKQNGYDLLLVESELQGQNGLNLFKEIQHKDYNLPFVLMTPVRDDRLVREAMKQGVSALIIKSESHFRDLSERLKEAYQKFYGQKGTKSAISKIHFFEAKMRETVSRQPQQPEISDLSIKDELTGLYNHSYLQERIVREFSRAVRYHYPLSCILMDIDHFKVLNEERGYRVGDTVLKECANLLFDSCRMSDLVSRYGGEEFGVLLPHIDYQGARELSKRLRLSFSEHIFLSGLADVNLTVSIGISSFPEDSMARRSDLIGFARQALLRSKAQGRNRITLYRDIMPGLGAEIPELKISEDKIAEFQRRLSEISEATRRSYIEASRTLIFALESKDRFTAGHAASCAKYARQLAEVMGMSIEDAEVVEHATLLHDIGKLCIPDEILLKPGKLTFIEYENMKQHPYLGFQILKPIKFLREEAGLVLHHHEWFNGEGYPSHLKGEEIPLGARIISVIDSYDTMRIAGGRYKKTITVVDAVNELIAFAGTQFDPKVVKAFINVLKMRKELASEEYDKRLLDERLQTDSKKGRHPLTQNA